MKRYSVISNNTQYFLFFGALIGLILYLFPFQEEKLVFRRLDPQIRRFERSGNLNTQNFCRTLTPRTNDTLSHLMARRMSAAVVSQEGVPCYLEIVQTHISRFSLTTRRAILIRLFKGDTPAPLIEHAFAVEYPRPLCFLPLFLFFLALMLQRPFWGLGTSFTTYLLVLSNFNLIDTVRKTYSVAELVVSTDKTWLGFTLLTFFLVLSRQEIQKKGFRRHALSPAENSLNRFFLGSIGLWNPAFFSHILTLLFRSTRARRLSYYFDAQLLVALLSLYLFSLKDRFSLEGLRQSIFLPRYFTFAVCLGLFVTYAGDRKIRKIPFWAVTGFRRHFFAVLLVEGAGMLWPSIKIFPTLTRVSFALLLSQLTVISQFQWRPFLSDCTQPVAWIFLTALVTMVSVEAGVTDLALTVFEPRAHPSVLTFFTYISGIFVGVLTGSFSTAFFTLVPAILNGQTNPIVRAALFDGILAGSLLSPFSLFTLLPAAMLKVPLNDVIRFRIKRLAIPLAIGGVIYALSTVNSVGILRPVTFIFLCLSLVIYKLHRNQWRISRVWPWALRLPRLRRDRV